MSRKTKQLTGPAKTRNYKPSYIPGPEWSYGIGLFNNRIVDAMRRDPQVSLCLDYRKATVHTAEFDYDANAPEVKAFVQEQTERFWRKGLSIAMENLSYGFSGSEVMYKEEGGYVKFDYLKPLYAFDVRAWSKNGRLAFLRVATLQAEYTPGADYFIDVNKRPDDEEDEDVGYVYLRAASKDWPTKGFWTVHDNMYHQYYGRSLLAPAWLPWRWKTMPDGANDIIAKWYYRHAYSGMVVRHPDTTYQTSAGGPETPAVDYARQMGQQTKTGANLTMSSARDENGQYLWDITQYAKIEGSGKDLIDYVNAYLDIQIQRGIGIPDELITHQGDTGGWSRSKVSLTAYLISSEIIMHEIIEAWVDQILRPLVRMNFGKAARFAIKPKTLIQQEAGQGGPGGAQPGGDKPPQLPPAPQQGNPFGGGENPPMQMSYGDSQGWRPSWLRDGKSTVAPIVQKALDDHLESESWRLSGHAADDLQQADLIAQILLGIYGEKAGKFMDALDPGIRLSAEWAAFTTRNGHLGARNTGNPDQRLYGEDAAKVLRAQHSLAESRPGQGGHPEDAQATADAKWDDALHPRGPDGKFIRRNSPAALAAVTRGIKEELRNQNHTPEGMQKLVGLMSLLTVEQLRGVASRYQIMPGQKSARAELRDRIAERLSRGRRQQPTQPGAVDNGGAGSGSAGGINKLVVARPEQTAAKPANPALVPEDLRKHLTIPGPDGTTLDHQLEGAARAIEALATTGAFLLADGAGAGKAQPLDEPILTSNGWKRMGELRIGEQVVSVDGMACDIVGVFPQGEQDVYRVRFSDGTWTESTAEHLWFTQTDRDRHNSRRGLPWNGKARELSEIMQTLHGRAGRTNHSIPITQAVSFPYRETLIPAYTMGILLGDGALTRKHRVEFHNADAEVASFVTAELPANMKVVRRRDIAWNIAKMRSGAGNRYLTELRRYELHGPGKTAETKFIPDDYKFNSAEVRLSILQGLMDTDGTVNRKGTHTSFCSTSRQLADDVIFLVQSLGGIATLTLRQPWCKHKGTRRKGRLAFNVTVTLPPHLMPFRLSRKANRVRPKTKYTPKRYIVGVEHIGRKLCQCIAVNHPSHLYLTRSFIVTHNTRQMLATAATFARQGKKVLMVSPAGIIKPDWDKNQISGSIGKDGAAMGIGLTLDKGGTSDPLQAGKVSVTTYEQLGKFVNKIDKDTLVIFDEAHGLKNAESARSKHGNAISAKAGAAMYGTATPADQTANLAYLFRAQIEPPPWQETLKRLDAKKSSAVENLKATSEVFDKLTEKGLMLKREISLDNVEAKFEHITLSDEAKAELAAVAAGKTSRERAQSLMKQRFLQERHKIPHAVNAIQQELAEGRQAVVFLAGVSGGEGGENEDGTMNPASEGNVAMLRKALVAAGIPEEHIGELHGAVKNGREMVGDFQSGKRKILITTPQSGGTGHNLDDTTGTAPRTQIVVTAPFSAIDNSQMWGRTHRLTTKSKSRMRYLFGDTAVEHWNADLIRSKVATLGAIVGGEAHKQNVPEFAVAMSASERDSRDPDANEIMHQSMAAASAVYHEVRDELQRRIARKKVKAPPSAK